MSALLGGGGGGLVLMGQGLVTSAVAAVDITAGAWSAMHAVRLLVSGVELASSALLQARIIRGGTVYTAGNYYYAFNETTHVSTGGDTTSVAGSSFPIAGAQRNDSVVYHPDFEATFFDLNATTRYPKCVWQSSVWLAAPDGPAHRSGGGMVGATGTVMDGVRLFASAGNINKLQYSLFGVPAGA